MPLIHKYPSGGNGGGCYEYHRLHRHFSGVIHSVGQKIPKGIVFHYLHHRQQQKLQRKHYQSRDRRYKACAYTFFCGVTNCPITAIILSVELFGGAALPFFALACAASYLLSGYSSLYGAQRIVLDKWRIGE